MKPIETKIIRLNSTIRGFGRELSTRGGKKVKNRAAVGKDVVCLSNTTWEIRKVTERGRWKRPEEEFF